MVLARRETTAGPAVDDNEADDDEHNDDNDDDEVDADDAVDACRDRLGALVWRDWNRASMGTELSLLNPRK